MNIETTRDVERLFVKKIAEYNRDERRRGELHLTDITSECIRAVWYDKHDPYPEDPSNILRMWQGTMMHQMPLLEQHELELEFEGVKTRIDEFENGILIEKKFVTFIPKDQKELEKYYSHYVKQVEYEALMLTANGFNVNKAFLLFVIRGEPESGRLPVVAYEVPINIDNIASRFAEEVEMYKLVLASDELPEIPRNFTPFDYPCTYCKYRARCFGA